MSQKQLDSVGETCFSEPHHGWGGGPVSLDHIAFVEESTVVRNGGQHRLRLWKKQVHNFQIVCKRFLVIEGSSGSARHTLAMKLCCDRPRIVIDDYVHALQTLAALIPGHRTTVIFEEPPIQFILGHRDLFLATPHATVLTGSLSAGATGAISLWWCDIIVLSSAWTSTLASAEDNVATWLGENSLHVQLLCS